MSTPNSRPPSKPVRQWRRPVVEEHINQHPAPIAAALAAGSAIAFGFIATFTVIMAAWLIAAHGTETVNQVLKASGISWLGLQLVPVTIGTQTIGLLPWGFIALPIYFLWRSTHWAIKSAEPKTSKDFWSLAGLLAGFYALANLALAVICSTTSLSVNYLEVVLRTFTLGALVSTATILTFAPSKSEIIGRLPVAVRDAIKPGFTAFMVLVGLGSALCTVSIFVHFREISAVAEVMAPVSVDGFFLMLLGVGYLPTAAVWSMAYMIGPGVVVGGTGVVSIYQSNPGALPAFPLLSVLPDSAPASAKLFILAPLFVGVLLYLLLPRDAWQPDGDNFTSHIRNLIRPSELVSLISALVVVASCTLLVATAASGSLGSQLLKFVGPRPLAVATILTIELASTYLFFLVLPRMLLSLMNLWQHRREPVSSAGN